MYTTRIKFYQESNYFTILWILCPTLIHVILYLEIFCIILDQNITSNIRNVAESNMLLAIKHQKFADWLS